MEFEPICSTEENIHTRSLEHFHPSTLPPWIALDFLLIYDFERMRLVCRKWQAYLDVVFSFTYSNHRSCEGGRMPHLVSISNFIGNTFFFYNTKFVFGAPRRVKRTRYISFNLNANATVLLNHSSLEGSCRYFTRVSTITTPSIFSVPGVGPLDPGTPSYEYGIYFRK